MANAAGEFFAKVPTDKFVLILDNVQEILKILQESTTLLRTGVSCLRNALQVHVDALSSSTKPEVKAFNSLYKKWLDNLVNPNAKIMPPPKKKNEPEFVAINKDWSFNPKELTEHQIERMKERRDDIPALYNDNSVSQDTRSLQAWAPKAVCAVSEGNETKTTFSGLVNGNHNKDKPEEDPLKITSNDNPTTPNERTEQSTPSPELNNSRSGTPTHKKKSRCELSRLVIDTVEGNVVFGGDKKTRTKRRASMDTRRRDSSDLKTSPKKQTNDDQNTTKITTVNDNSKSRRVTINGDVKKERSLKPVPEETVKEPLKEVLVAEPILAKGDVGESVVVVVQKLSSKSAVLENKNKAPMVVIPTDVGAVETPSGTETVEPRTIDQPMEIISEKTTTEDTNKDPKGNKETAPVVEKEPLELMDVGSESLVNEMNLVVSANNSSVNQQRSILSSPDAENVDERESTFLNDTVNISPIMKVAEPKETNTATLKELPKTAEGKVQEVLTTPKRCMDPAQSKENNPSGISTTPLLFRNGRGAQMLQQTKLFQESTPKEKPREESVMNKEDTIQRMLIKTAPSVKSSPSTSILRRKRLEVDMDDSYDSPAAKVRILFSIYIIFIK